MVARSVFLVAVLLLGSLAAHAQDPASFSFTADPTPARPGETVTVWIDVTLSGDWHIYSTTTPPGGPYPTEIVLEGSAFTPVGAALQPDPVKEHDPNFDMLVEYYGGTVRFGTRAGVNADAGAGSQDLRASITYMLCNATMCLPPTTVQETVTVRIEEGDARPEFVQALAAPAPPASSVRPEPADETLDGSGSIADVDRALTEGLGAFLYLSFSMGLLALLTPCVFPMVPITVSFFTKQGETSGKRGSVTRSFVYCGGIMLTFTGLGLLLAGTLGASGAAQFAANPWVNLVITGIFVAFALSLFGLFEIQLPTSLLNRLNSSQAGGYGGILLMGFTFSLTSFTCTAPFVGTLLVLTTQGTWAWPILGMVAFAAAFALPFFFLSLFPQGLGALPKSGGWLNSVKVVMGFLELAAALKFLSNVDLVWNWGFISREVFLAAWVAIFLVCGIYLLGKVRLPHDTPVDAIGPLRLMATVGCFAFGIYLVTGLFGAPLGELDAFFPPYGSRGQQIAEIRGSDSLEWSHDYDAAMARAEATGKNVFIDFTGYACTNCRWMEANIFPRPDIRSLLDDYILVQLYTDGQGEKYTRNREFQESRFGTVALPFYAIVGPSGETIATFPGMTRDAARFAKFLHKGIGSGLQANRLSSLP